MITSNAIQNNSLVFTRLIGQSECENVRAGLLQIAAFNPLSIRAQIQGAIMAADVLNMRLRIFVNPSINQTMAGPEYHEIERLDFGLCRSKDHDFMTCSKTEKSFNEVMANVDIVISPQDQTEISPLDVAAGIRSIWLQTGGRGGILDGRGPTQDKKIISQYIVDKNKIWADFNLDVAALSGITLPLTTTSNK